MFIKGTYDPNVTIAVTLPTRPDEEYVFTFPKRLPQAALDAEEAFVALADQEERTEVFRQSLVKLVATMLVGEPKGFDDFPGDERPLEERAVVYFDDPEEPELETILVRAWGKFKEVTRANARYLKSVADNRAGSGQPSGVSREASPVI